MSNLPGSLIRTPDLDRWIAIENDGSIIVSTGKVELGQGILTAIQLIAAEELDVDPDQIHVRSAETGITPNEMVTAGSMSVETSGAAVRQACAWARRLMLSEVSDDPAQLEVSSGIVTGPGLNAPTSYTEIQAGTPFKFQIVDPTQEKTPPNTRCLVATTMSEWTSKTKFGAWVSSYTISNSQTCCMRALFVPPPIIID